MQLTYNNNQIKIDNGDHYYTGLIKKESFPENLRSDFEDIIEKSFNDFSDDNYTVIHSLSEDNKSPIILCFLSFKYSPSYNRPSGHE